MPEATGLHTKFLRETDVPGTFDEIAMVANITPPQLQRDVVEVDNLNPANDVKKKLLGLIDAGEMTVTLNFDPEDAGHQDLESDFHAGLEHNYRIEFPYDATQFLSGGYYDIVGVVTGFAPQEISAGDVMQAEVTIAVTAKPEYTPASPVI
jgi:hypothetical protein